jgi:diguanylate cyclase (GGDEF)-like protein
MALATVASDTHPPRVLVADDSSIVRKILAAGLREGGFAIVEAKDGAEALEILRREPFDVVVTDMQMPGVDGLGVLERVRSEGLGAEVIVLTGARAEDVEAAIGALRLGAHDYIVKGPSSGPAVKLSVEQALEKKRKRDDNLRLVEELRTLSLRDSLTGLPNRRALDLTLAQEVDRAQRVGQPLSLLIFDLDHFKAVNDSYGHAAGDQVLRHFARVAAGVFRRADTVHRYGGEEFAAILPAAAERGALDAAARLVKQAAASPIDVGKAVVVVTCSVGVASFTGDGAITVEALVTAADAALYEAKRTGRNRAVLSTAFPAATPRRRAPASAHPRS